MTTPHKKLKTTVESWNSRNPMHPIRIGTPEEILKRTEGVTAPEGIAAFLPKSARPSAEKTVVFAFGDGTYTFASIARLTTVFDEYLKNEQLKTWVADEVSNVGSSWTCENIDVEKKQVTFQDVLALSKGAPKRRKDRRRSVMDLNDFLDFKGLINIDGVYLKFLRERFGECPVCYGLIDSERGKFPCEHVICLRCYIKVRKCPLCRCDKSKYIMWDLEKKL